MAWKLAYHANCWGPLGGDAVGVTSISKLAYRTFGDMAQAARDIAAAGYTGIEIFDGNVVDGETDGYRSIRRILDETGLQLVSLYSGGNFIFADILDGRLRCGAGIALAKQDRMRDDAMKALTPMASRPGWCFSAPNPQRPGRSRRAGHRQSRDRHLSKARQFAQAACLLWNKERMTSAGRGGDPLTAMMPTRIERALPDARSVPVDVYGFVGCPGLEVSGSCSGFPIRLPPESTLRASCFTRST